MYSPQKGAIAGWVVLLIICIISACNPTRRLQKDEYLLNRNVILKNNTLISDAELLPYVRQKPNRKILGLWRFHLWMYNTVNQEKFTPRYENRLKNRATLNEKRKEEGKKPKNAEPVSLGKWRLAVGEAPVILDTALTNRSAKQIELFLKNHGYFHAVVKDSVGKQAGRKQMRNAFFTIDAGKPYTVHSIEYEIDDPTVLQLIL
ncbi:MAG: hypothetical protein RLZZ543_1359, partial [Bacteroidota bacterium]